MADNDNNAPVETTAIEQIVGHPNGEVLPSGETIVYDYDEDGQFIGWHKGK